MLAIMTKIFLAFLFGFVIVAADCYAAQNQMPDASQERCSESTAVVFKTDEHGNAKAPDEQSSVRYEHHFSASLNRCFARQTITSFSGTSGKSPSSQYYTIYDVNADKSMASMMKLPEGDKVVVCFVNGKACHSEAEFDELTKPFMEQ